ncbi:hypothetical protein L227DRAFT_535215 [Lentinus tigrinus ALCF2SS1-6]|uniref:BTB domain-containing protein n=1 Tax=Lentinus tigrinus ALCF2SS1-6 TaxID=1328759 RepID=A0A5C2RT01_9APHY|nr:hypothetical protein L227DRAFT_535215 [Lentinus tigrinus ALCF2SS1-6]
MPGQPGAREPEALQAPAPLQAYDASTVLAAFTPAFQFNDALPDVCLITADNLPFYTHRQVLQFASTNTFGGLLANHDESINVSESYTVLPIVLHIIYGLSCLHLSPSLDTVDLAVDALVKYGVPVSKFAAPNSPLYQLIISHAPYRPIDTYALAAHHGLEPLAVDVSAHLLSYDTSNLTDELSLKMGPVYIKRLFSLHLTRRAALKDIVMKPPALHHPNLACGTGEQRQLTQAWALAAAEMAWDVRPSTSTYMLQSVFEKAGRDITCGECRVMLEQRIQEAIDEWSAVRRTI